jgi:hypothetical protein
MRRALIQSAALLALIGAVVWASGRGSTSVGETSCTRLVSAWASEWALAQGVEVTRLHLLACRQDGDKATARVEITVRASYRDWTGKWVSESADKVVVIRFAKSPWQIVGGKFVDG